MRIYSFIAYDNHGNLLGYLTDKPYKEGTVVVWKDDNRPQYVERKEIGRIESFNLQAINRDRGHKER